jgi:hypothetical protein
MKDLATKGGVTPLLDETGFNISLYTKRKKQQCLEQE